MKMWLRLIVAFGVVMGLLTLLGSVINRETLLEALANQLRWLSITAYALLGNYAYSEMEASAFGGWKLKIYIDGKLLENEGEFLEPEEVRKIIKYWWSWALASFGDVAMLRKRPWLERLLRECFESQGEILGDPRDFVTIEGRCLVLRLSEENIRRVKVKD